MPPHDEHHDHGSELSEMTLRVRALETILTEKGYVDPAALDLIVEAYETKIGPRNGAKVVAQGLERSGVQARAPRRRDQGRRHARLCRPRRRPSGRGREHAEAPQHGRLHALLLLPDGPARPAAGLVQVGALPLARGQGPARRAGRFRRDPAGRHGNPGWDSTAETRFLVLPMRPAGTDGLDEEQARRAGHPRLDDRHRPCDAARGGGP